MTSLAHTCARLSRLAYEDNPDLGEVGQTLVAKFDCGGTQAFISKPIIHRHHWLTGNLPDNRMFLVFRGTSEIGDFKADLRYVKTDFFGGGRVHLGFYTAFRKIEGAILDERENHLGSLWICSGHSLGAALALLAAARWKLTVAYLYGCPRVGNKAFVDRVQCPVRRFENRGDFVTRLPPPSSPLQIWHSLTHGRRPTLYRQAGKCVRLSEFGHGVSGYVDATAGM